ncbi:spermatogenesis-associated protein 31G1 isoform X2 [Notamacropus eugenii]
MRLDPQWYFHPRKMEAEQKASFFQKETLGTLNEDVGNLYPSILGPHGEYQPFVGSKEFPVKTVIPELMPNSHYLHSPTNLIQAPTSLCPLSTSSAKAKESIQLFWGLPSLHSESLGAIFPKSYCNFPTGATNEQLLSDPPIIFFNEFSYLLLPNLLVKTVSLPPPYLSLSSPLPVLHGNCEVAEMASPEFPDGPEVAWWASESQDPILDPQLPLLSPQHSPVKPQQVDFMEVTKVMTSDAYDVPGPQDVQQSKLPWSPKSPAQTLSPPSVLLPEPQGPVEDPKVIVSEVLLGDQWQIQFPQDPDPSAPALNASPPQLLIPQEASLMGAWNETAPMILHGPKASCYDTQQSELPWDVGTPASCLSLPEPQGTDPTENPLMIPHVPEFPWYNMQEKEPPCPAAPLAPVLNMNLQSELQGASFIEVPKGLIPSWDRMQTPPPWTSGLSSFPQAEPQEVNSEESPVPSASPVLPGWGVQQTHLPCTLRHNTPPPESPSQTWPTTLRVPAEMREDEHHPPGSFTGAMLPMSKIVTSIPQEEGAMGEAPLHSQGILGPGTEGCPWIKEPRIQLKKAQCNPGSPSLAPSPPFPGLFFPRTSSQQDLCSLATPFYPTTCQIPAPNPTSQGALGTLSSNYAHVQAKAMSPNAQPLHCHPPAFPQLLLQELSRDGQGPAREGKKVPLMPPQTPDLQATKVPEPQSLSQYKARAATKRPCAPRRAIREGSEKSDPPAPDKSQAQASVPSRKREHSRKPKAGDQGGGDARWGASLSKGKSHSSEAKKLTSHLPARKSLVSPHQASRNLCQTTSHLDLLQPSPKAETSQVLPSQSPSKGQRVGGGDSSDSRHQQNHSQGGKFPRREARKRSSSSSSGPAKRGLKKFLEGLLNSLSHSQRDQSMECLQAVMKIAQGSRSSQALRLTPQ